MHRFRDVSSKTVLSYLEDRRLQYIVLFILPEHMPRVTMEPIKLCQVIGLWQGHGQEGYSWMAGWNVVLEALKNFPGVCAV